MNNVVLVQTHDLIVNRYLPLAIGNIWVYAHQSEYVRKNYKIADVIIDKIDPEEYIESIDFIPNVFAFSVYLWNFKHTKSFAKTIKKHFPQCKIIVGGPQISKHDPYYFEKHPYFDITVLGEGEVCFRKILENNCEPISYPNVFYKGMPMPRLINRIHDLTLMPSPIQSGFYDDIMKKYNNKYKNVTWGIIYETMRGCPYHCAFCDIGDSYHNKVKKYNIERIYKDIDWMSKNKIEYVSIADSNWGIFERDIDISKYVVDNKLKYGYPKHWDVTFAKNNYDRVFKIAIYDKLSKTNLFKGVTFAYQSTDKNVLSAIDRFNIDPIKSKSLMSMFRKHNVPMYSELVFPLPNDTIDTLKQSIEDLLNYGQKDFLMIHTTAVTPNATLSTKEMRETYKIKTKFLPVNTHTIDRNNKKNYIDDEEMLISTNTLSKSDHVTAYCFSWAIITLFYYGWAHYIIEYLVKTQKKKYIHVIQQIIDFGEEDNKNIFYKEYKKTKNHFLKVLSSKKLWGRKLFGNKGLHFELKAASSCVFLQNKKKFYQFMEKFLKQKANINSKKAKQLVEFNESSCFDFRESYPLEKTFDRDIVMNLI